MSHIGEVIDNYYNISLEDRVTLIEKLQELHYENMSDFTCGYFDSLDTIEIVAKKMLQASKFEEFFNALNAKEKKEFQTQLYELSYKTNNWAWHSIPKVYDRVKKIYGLEYTPIEKKEIFPVDFTKLDEELNDCGYLFEIPDTLDPERVISVFCKRYYRYAIDRLEGTKLSDEEKERLIKKYSDPLISEFNELMDSVIKVICKNINMSTKKKFCSLSKENQLYTVFQALDIDKERLDDKIEYRAKIREVNKKLSYRNMYIPDTPAKQRVKKKEPIIRPRIKK